MLGDQEDDEILCKRGIYLIKTKYTKPQISSQL